MNNLQKQRIDILEAEHKLPYTEYVSLLSERDDESFAYITEKAVNVRKRIYGNDVYIRGLIEISNICKNNCYYCGIRAGNHSCERYRLTKDQILSCCKTGYLLGFRTFVLQGGEDPHFSDDVVCDIVQKIKSEYHDVAVTLSLGERSRASYQTMFDAGADRYLLRHETANSAHYSLLHPESLSFTNRMRCLYDLKDIGYQVGCGFMVGSPGQGYAEIANDLKFIEEFRPHMCGIGPFLPHRDTPFANEQSGSGELTLFLLSVIRLMLPNILLPATTALGTLDQNGRQKGILAGANVIMPNLSPEEVRNKYELYNNKLSSGSEAAEGLKLLKENMRSIGYNVVVDRGDYKY